MPIQTLASLGDLHGKRVLLRVDVNVPMVKGKVSDATRILRILPTVRYLQEAGAKVIMLSHFGRPKAGYEPEFSLAPIADAISEHLGSPVRFGVDCIGLEAERAIEKLEEGGVVLLENLRFHAGEKKNDPAFAKALATLADIYVNDAFSCSHRAHASIVGVAALLPSAAGLLLEEEITHLSQALTDPKRPLAAIVGGSKVSTKITILEELVKKVDHLCIGGGMANTFIAANGTNVGKSLYEPDFIPMAQDIIKAATAANCELHIPTDGVVAKAFAAGAENTIVDVTNIPADGMMLDIGPETVSHWSAILKTCNTVVWNGPLGAFEISPFDVGTVSIARVIAKHDMLSVAGGGDVLSALSACGLRNELSYLSTAGGAFLEWLEGKTLPGVACLEV